jgi:aspartate racemase
VGLLGSRHTMDQDSILKDRLNSKFGLNVLVPEGADHAEVDRIVYRELVRGQFPESSRANCAAIIARLVSRGAQATILGCTELPMLVKPEDSPAPLFDTTTLHASAAVDLALA